MVKLFRQLYDRFNFQSPMVTLIMITLLVFIPITLILSTHMDGYKRVQKIQDQIEVKWGLMRNQEERIRGEINNLLWGEAIRMYEQIDGKLSKEVLLHLIKESYAHDIAPEILLNLIRVESNFDPEAVGPQTPWGRAYGLSQFMENTAPWVAKMAGVDYEFDQLFDPYYSITLAATYLHYLHYGDGKSHQGFGDWHATLTAYNRGIYGYSNYYKEKQTSVSTYSEKIISQIQQPLNP